MKLDITWEEIDAILNEHFVEMSKEEKVLVNRIKNNYMVDYCILQFNKLQKIEKKSL